MSIDKETLEYNNEWSGEVYGSINVEDCEINCKFKFHKEGNEIRVDYAQHYSVNLKTVFNCNEVFMGIEDEIFEAIEEKENTDTDDVSDYFGEGYNGAIK